MIIVDMYPLSYQNIPHHSIQGKEILVVVLNVMEAKMVVWEISTLHTQEEKHEDSLTEPM